MYVIFGKFPKRQSLVPPSPERRYNDEALIREEIFPFIHDFILELFIPGLFAFQGEVCLEFTTDFLLFFSATNKKI